MKSKAQLTATSFAWPVQSWLYDPLPEDHKACASNQVCRYRKRNADDNDKDKPWKVQHEVHYGFEIHIEMNPDRPQAKPHTHKDERSDKHTSNLFAG